jgi:DNA-binding PadR family transcriptional regulator
MKGEVFMPESNERGALTEAVYYILLSLFKPMHGYGIMQNVRELSKDRVNLGPGTLYGAINTLLEKKWIQYIEGEWDSRKKEYQITQTGKQVVIQEIERLEELVGNGKRIIGGEFNEVCY